MTTTTGQAPLFPLPNGALLPGELLPLHIFEPRYRAMMDAVRTADRMLAIGTLLPGWEADYYGSPPVADVVGVGRLVKDRQNPDGTSDIVLHGLVRGEITEELDGQPFRRVVLRLHAGDEDHPAVAFRLRRRLVEGLGACLPDDDLEADVTATYEVGALVDRIASALELTPTQRVGFLQSLQPEQRVDALLEVLGQTKHRDRLRAIVPALGDFSLRLQDGKEPTP